MTQSDRTAISAPISRPPVRGQTQTGGDETSLSRERIRQKLRERASALAAPRVDAASGAVIKLISFSWRGQQWAVDADAVQEVIKVANPTALPGLPPAYLNLIHYRGEVFPLVNIAALFGIGSDCTGKPTHALIVGGNGSAIAIAADAVEGLSQIEVATIAAMPPDAANHDALQGLTPDLAILFDPHHLLGDARLVVNDQPATPSRTEGKAQ